MNDFIQCSIFDGQLHGFEGTVSSILDFKYDCWTCAAVDTGKKGDKSRVIRNGRWRRRDDWQAGGCTGDAGGLTPHPTVLPRSSGILYIPPYVLAVAAYHSGLLPFH